MTTTWKRLLKALGIHWDQKGDTLPSWSRSVWVLPQEADAETQFGVKKANVCVGDGGVWCGTYGR